MLTLPTAECYCHIHNQNNIFSCQDFDPLAEVFTFVIFQLMVVINFSDLAQFVAPLIGSHLISPLGTYCTDGQVFLPLVTDFLIYFFIFSTNIGGPHESNSYKKY